MTYAAAFSNSSENDYEADTATLSISQDMFGDLTTVSLFFTRGWDDVTRRGDATFADEVDRRIYGVDISQVATKNMVLGLSYETITEEGFLNNPYRQVRYLDPDAAVGFSFEPERYPRTRTGNALSLRARYFLPYRAAIQGDYRFYTDTWDILAHTAEVSYTHPLDDEWTFDVRYRFYTQDAAEFYSDLFPRADFQNFLARDKELSTMTSHTLGFGVAYDVQVAAHVVPQPRVAEPALRPHALRVRRLPRHQHDRLRPGHRALLLVRRGRHPLLLLRLVLGKGTVHLLNGTDTFRGDCPL